MNFKVTELPGAGCASAAAYETATEAQAHVDEEMRKLRSLRNTFSPTCRLPLEILTTIFVLCALDHHRHESSTNRRIHWNEPSGDVPDWVNVSYICHHWRDAALNCPTLWTYHFMVSLQWTEELLVRSKHAPLKVHLRINYPDPNFWWLKPVEKLLKHAERFEDPSLHLKDWNATQVLSMLCKPLHGPCLRNLKISTLSFDYEQSFLPFQGDTPALRTLDLSYCPVSWRSVNHSSLTTLNLSSLPDEFRESTVDILASLRNMEDLTELTTNRSLRNARHRSWSGSDRGQQYPQGSWGRTMKAFLMGSSSRRERAVCDPALLREQALKGVKNGLRLIYER